jgi:hypothetical protein
MAFETQQALKKLQRKYGDVDEFVRKRLSIYATKEEMWQVLAAEQVDGVALAIDNIESGQGFIIGDQTGIGKGRQAAAIILYCKMNGYNCVFVTKTADLLSDMYRDFKDIKADFIVPYVFNETDLIDPEVKLTEKEIEKGTGKNLLWVLKDDVRYKKKNNKDHNDNLDGQRKLPEGYDFVMTTYSQLTEDKVAKEAAKKAEYGENKWQEHYSFTENSQARCEFLRQYAKGSIIVMDEAHLASGKFSTTGFFFKEAVTNSHSTIFLSATYAKRPENMPIYALKTALSEANITEDEFETVFEIGDVPLQELVAAELTRNGQMIRRQRPFNGIDVNYKILNDIETSDRHIRYYDKVMEVIRAVMAFEKNFVSEEQQVVMQQIGFKGEVNDNQTIQTTGSDLFSKIHSIARQLLFALKAGDVADLALELLRQNKKVVIAFSSTNETFLKEMNLSAGDVVSDFSFSTILQRLLNKTLNFSAKREDGVIENFKIDPFNVGTEFENTFENLSREIYDLGQELGLMSVSPIDDIINKIQSAARPNDKIGGIASANYRVRECTGRSAQIKVEKGQPIYYSFKSNKKQFFKDFNSGNADVLLINSAASTGVSCHAYYKFADTRQRSMIIHQPELDINEEIQKRGRINRTGQEMVSGLPYFDKKGNVATVHVQEETPTDTNGYWINLGNNKKVSVFDDKSSVWKVHPTAQSNLPEYWYVSTVIPTEERALKMLKKKLKSLDSLTTGNQKANDDQLDTEDFFNKYGDRVVRDFMKSKKNQKAYERYRINEGVSMKAATNRISVAPYEIQAEFYDSMNQSYKSYVKTLKELGEYDLELEFFDYKARELSRSVYVSTGIKNPKTTFGQDAIRSICEINPIRKPFTFAKVQKIINDNLGKFTPESYRAYLLEKYEIFKEKYFVDIDAKATEKIDRETSVYDERIEKVVTRIAGLELEYEKTEEEKRALKINSQIGAFQTKLMELKEGRIGKIKEITSEAASTAEFNKGRIQRAELVLRRLTVGMPTKVSEGTMENGEFTGSVTYYNAIVLNVEPDFSQANPFNPSAMQVRVAVANSDGTYNYKLSSDDLYIKSLISNAKMSPAEKEGIVVDWNRHIPEDRKQAAVFIKENVLLALANVVREKGIKSDKKRKYDDKTTAKDDVDYALGRIVKYSDNLGEIFTAVQVGKTIPNVANIQDKFVNIPLFSENFFDYVNKLPFGEEIYISPKMLLQKRPSGYVLIIPNNYSKVFGDKTISLLLLNVTGGSHWGARWKVGTAKTLEGYISSETFTKFIKKLYDKTKVYIKIEGSLEPKTKMLTPLGKKGRYYYETEKYFPDAMPEQYRIKVDGAKGKPAILTYEYPLPPKGRYQFDLKPFYKTIEDLYVAWESGLSETQKQYAKGSFVKEISGLDKQVQINRIALFIEQNAHEEGQPIYVFGTKFNARDLANMFYKKYINSAADTRFTRLKKLTEIVKYWHQANKKRA